MIHFGNHEHGEMVMASIGSKFAPVNMQVISRSENGVFRGGVVYENWTGEGGSILVHVAAMDKHWINRDMLWVMFDYPFNQLKVNQAFCQVAGKNEECLRFCRSVGWSEVIRLEAVFPDDDMILMRLWRKDCRFLNLKPRTLRSNKGVEDGKAESATAARL